MPEEVAVESESASDGQAQEINIFDSEPGVLSAALGLPHKAVTAGEVTFDPKPIKVKPIPPVKAAPAPASPKPSENGVDGTESGKFEFGGVEFANQAAAEHAFKTLRGMHRSAESRHAALTEANRKLTEQVAKLTKAVGEGKAKPAEGGAVKPGGAYEGLDAPKLAQYIGKLQAEGRHDDAAALLTDYLSQQQQAAESALRAELDKRLKPHEDARRSEADEQEIEAAAAESFQLIGGALDDKGQPLYGLLALDPESVDTDEPKMLHPAHAKAVLATWTALQRGAKYHGAEYPPMDGRFAASPAGVHIAQSVYFFESLRPYAVPLLEALRGDYLPELLGLRQPTKGERKPAQSKAPLQGQARRQAPVFDTAPVKPVDDDPATPGDPVVKLMASITRRSAGII